MNKHRHLLVQRTKDRRQQGSARPKPVQRDPNLVPLEEVRERALQELSAAFARQLREQRSDLSGLSFFCEESAKPRRIELSKLINRLKGKWKIADNAKATNFIIVDASILKGRSEKVPRSFLAICDEVCFRAEQHLADQQQTQYSNIQENNCPADNQPNALNPQSRDQFAQRGPTQSHQSIAMHQGATALRRAFPLNFSRRQEPAQARQRLPMGRQNPTSLTRQNNRAIHIDKLRSFLPSVDEVSLFGRQVLASDLTAALRFLESQTAAFHTSRLKTVFLEKDQAKPSAFSDDGAFFCVSKLNFGGPEDREQAQGQLSAHMRDLVTRQLFHEFDKMSTLLPNGSSPTPENLSTLRHQSGISPAKTRSLQVAAIAQQKVEDERNPKASPAGHLNRSLVQDPMSAANFKLRQRYNTHVIDFKTPNGYCPCVSKTEKQFVMQNFELIERQRAKENQKQLQRAYEANNDVHPWHNESLLEPIPNEQHTYCQVCNETYEDYLDHIQNSTTHKKRAKIQDGPFAEFDLIAEELNRKQKWVNNWKAEPIVEYPMASMAGYSNLSGGAALIDAAPHEGHSVSQRSLQIGSQHLGLAPLGGSHSKRKRGTWKPPTPFKLGPSQAFMSSQISLESGKPQAEESGAPMRSQDQPSAKWPENPTTSHKEEEAPESQALHPLVELQRHSSVCPNDILPQGDSQIQKSDQKSLNAAQPAVPESNTLILASQDNELQDRESEEHSCDNECSDVSSSDSADDEQDPIKRQIRDSMHKTHLHSVNRPLQETTLYQQQNCGGEEEPDKQECTSQSDGVDLDMQDESPMSDGERDSDSDYDGESADEDDTDQEESGMVLGSAIEREEEMRFMRVEKSNALDEEEGKVEAVDESEKLRECVARTVVADNDLKVAAVNQVKETGGAQAPTVFESSPVNRKLNFDDAVVDKASQARKPTQIEIQRLQKLAAVRSSLHQSLASSPQLALSHKIDPQPESKECKPSLDFYKLLSPTKVPHTSPEGLPTNQQVNTEDSRKLDYTLNRPDWQQPTPDAFKNQAQEPKADPQALASQHDQESSSEPEFTYEQLAEALREENESEDDYPNVLTEEVTNDKRFADQMQDMVQAREQGHDFSVDLTPCSAKHETHNRVTVIGEEDLLLTPQKKPATNLVTVSSPITEKKVFTEKNSSKANNSFTSLKKLVATGRLVGSNDTFSAGKKSVPSLLTSNDKYSVVERSQSPSPERPQSERDSDRVAKELINGQIYAQNGFELSKAESSHQEDAANNNDGTFGNVSFGLQAEQAPSEEKPNDFKLLFEGKTKPLQVITQVSGPQLSVERLNREEREARDPQSLFGASSQAHLQSQPTFETPGEYTMNSSQGNMLMMVMTQPNQDETPGHFSSSAYRAQQSNSAHQIPPQISCQSSQQHIYESQGSSSRPYLPAPTTPSTFNIQQTVNIHMPPGATLTSTHSQRLMTLSTMPFTQSSSGYQQPSHQSTTSAYSKRTPYTTSSHNHKKAQAPAEARNQGQQGQNPMQQPRPCTGGQSRYVGRKTLPSRFHQGMRRVSAFGSKPSSASSATGLSQPFQGTSSLSKDALRMRKYLQNRASVAPQQATNNRTLNMTANVSSSGRLDKKRKYADAFPSSGQQQAPHQLAESVDDESFKKNGCFASIKDIDGPMHARRPLTKRLKRADNETLTAVEQQSQRGLADTTKTAELLFQQSSDRAAAARIVPSQLQR